MHIRIGPRAASRLFPAAWVREANNIPLQVVWNGPRDGGGYLPAHIAGTTRVGGQKIAKQQGVALANVSEDFGNAVHEYAHHLQAALPELDDLFQDLHRRRTSGDPLLALPDYGWIGRKDRYVDSYTGREYANWQKYRANGPALEVITRAYQMVFYPLPKAEKLGELVREDPEMLDFILGTLLRYDPKSGDRR